MGKEFYDELCKECDAILKKKTHTIADVEKFNTLCKAKKNLEQFGGYSERYSGERYTNMNHALNSPELSYGQGSYGYGQGGSYGDMSRDMGSSRRMSND